MVGVKVGEEVGERKFAGVTEAIDDEAGFGDELGEGEIEGDWRERRSGGGERERILEVMIEVGGF